MTETKKRKMSAAQRRARKRKIRNRRIAMTVALVLVVALASVGGTIAWLTATTTPVTNTFTSADVAIALTETWNTDANKDGKLDSWSAKMVPGAEYTKDPVVSVDGSKTDVDVYLFVKFEEINNPQTYLTYTSTLTTDNGWTQGDGTNIPTDVWYRVVHVGDNDKSWNLLADDKVTVKDTVTKDNMTTASAAQLKYTAYACQYQGFETNAAGAWASVNPTT